MKKILGKQQGFALVATILGVAIISVFGIAIMGVTTSNFKMTKTDGRSQSAYYIAEAGVNYIVDQINTEVSNNSIETRDAFYQHIDNLFTASTLHIDDFDKNNGEQPKALINVKHVGTSEDGNTRDYEIKSRGEIGNSRRTVSSVISIIWKQDSNELLNSLLFYAKNFTFEGSAINAPSGGIVMDGLETHNLNGGSALNISDMYFNGPVKMDGGSASFGSAEKPGKIFVNGDLELWNGTRNVYGDIRVNGKFRLKDAIIHGDVYVNGDLELGWTPQIQESATIYYTGDLEAPDNYNDSILSKSIKVHNVDSFEIPMIDFILKEDSWYVNNGYTIHGDEEGKIPANAKMLVDSYNNTEWQDITEEGEVVIVSKGDIILRGGNGFKGALIAPNGSVTYEGDGTFEGIIISKNELSLTKGGNYFKFKSLTEMFGNDINNLPVIPSNHAEDGSANNKKKASLIIKSNIREE